MKIEIQAKQLEKLSNIIWLISVVENMIKNIEVSKDHFKTLYGYENEQVAALYDTKLRVKQRLTRYYNKQLFKLENL